LERFFDVDDALGSLVGASNNISSSQEIWSLDNGIALCHGCHKNIERIRTELKNMFVI